ncbi:ion transport peptide isoform X2 [Nasonia vitripennis]|uniref:Ion transport peptide n=1 Tax=Nasonia vitripennis TaxID=7425 RepID=A0A7M7GEU9_NASVI|nr:ion transport peptide isoform X2 [Nasonia vitripennis]XP_032455041.1 ion transport peptide isoform X2 [Nasonia vitripennis]
MMQHRQERHGSRSRRAQSTSNSPVLGCRSQSRRATSTRRPLPRPAQLCSNVQHSSSPASSSIAWSPAPSYSSSSTSSSSNSMSLLSVLAWSMTLLLVSSCLGIADAGTLMGHPFSKRSFMDIQCKGVYDKALFARLDRICEDCYNLFREPQLHTLCRHNCFGTEYFTSCIQALLLEDEKEKFQDIAEYLGRKK